MPHMRFLVLDEADRLLDLGFSAQINTIIEVRYVPVVSVHLLPLLPSSALPIVVSLSALCLFHCLNRAPPHQAIDVARSKSGTPVGRVQTILLSATITKFVRALAGRVLNEPVAIDADSGTGTTKFLELPPKAPAASPHAAGVVDGRFLCLICRPRLLLASLAWAPCESCSLWLLSCPRCSISRSNCRGRDGRCVLGSKYYHFCVNLRTHPSCGPGGGDPGAASKDAPDSHFTPINLSQFFVPVPMKWRLVTLLGLLRRQVTDT